MMDSPFGSLIIQTFKKLPISAPKMIKTRANIPLAPSLLEYWNTGIMGKQNQNDGMLGRSFS
jgi:hypothetical protein